MPDLDGPQSDFISANFQAIWPVHLSGFTQLLTQLRNRFDGDLDLMLILAVIGDRTRPEHWSPELLTYRQMTRENFDQHLQNPINIQSIADSTGIPRETVRRKVSVLQEKGWVTRDLDGRLFIGRSAAPELEQSTSDTMVYLARLMTAFDAARRPKKESG